MWMLTVMSGHVACGGTGTKDAEDELIVADCGSTDGPEGESEEGSGDGTEPSGSDGAFKYIHAFDRSPGAACVAAVQMQSIRDGDCPSCDYSFEFLLTDSPADTTCDENNLDGTTYLLGLDTTTYDAPYVMAEYYGRWVAIFSAEVYEEYVYFLRYDYYNEPIEYADSTYYLTRVRTGYFSLP